MSRAQNPLCLRLEAKKYLFDIDRAAGLIEQFTDGETFVNYEFDDMMRSAVERQFEVIGEAISELARIEPEIAASISEHRRIIAFRNILIHGYADVDSRLVWDVIQTRLSQLRTDVTGLIESE